MIHITVKTKIHIEILTLVLKRVLAKEMSMYSKKDKRGSEQQ